MDLHPIYLLVHESLLLLVGFLQLQQGGLLSSSGLRTSPAVASLAGKHRPQSTWASETAVSVDMAPGLEITGSLVVICGLRRSTACGILPDQ